MMISFRDYASLMQTDMDVKPSQLSNSSDIVFSYRHGELLFSQCIVEKYRVHHLIVCREAVVFLLCKRPGKWSLRAAQV